MTVAWYDLVGLAGVGMILLAYLLLQVGRTDAGKLSYSLLNLAGASLIVLSLFYKFNLPALAMELCWIAISLVGVYRCLTRDGRAR